MDSHVTTGESAVGWLAAIPVNLPGGHTTTTTEGWPGQPGNTTERRPEGRNGTEDRQGAQRGHHTIE